MGKCILRERYSGALAAAAGGILCPAPGGYWE